MSGKQTTSKRRQFAAYVLDRLHRLDGPSMRPMFGGYGLYSRGYFFGLIWHDTLYLFTSQKSRGKYKRAGMESFLFSDAQRESNYFAVPNAVLANVNKLTTWAAEAVECRIEFEQLKSPTKAISNGLDTVMTKPLS